MGNIFSYLRWRGDLTFQERAFCEVDNLALALLAYADLSHIVPGIDQEETITMKDAWTAYQETEHPNGHTFDHAGELLKALAECRRFQNARLSGFRCVLDESIATQFAAVRIALDDGTTYISYRGTDETIVGWREDFRIGFERTPAQEMAAEYLVRSMENGGRYRVGGHSKGGNLAEYAALRCPEEKGGQIQEVWCNDSPGLCRELFSAEELERVTGKIIRILPGYSVIGTLFLYDEPDMIVESEADGLLQHDAYTWKVEGDSFIRRTERDPDSALLVGTFDQWIESADMEQRKVFTKDFFDSLEASGAKTMSEVAHGGIDGFGTVLMSLVTSESRTKLVVLKFLKSFLQNCTRIDFRQVLRERLLYRNIAIFLLGLFCVVAPSMALRLVGTAAGAALFLWSLRRLYGLVINGPEDLTLRKKRFVIYILLLCGAGAYMLNQEMVLLSTNLLIAIALFIFAYQTLKKAMKNGTSSASRFGMSAIAILCTILGVVSVALAGDQAVLFMISLGSLILIYGIAGIAYTLYQSGKQNTVAR